MVEINPVPPFQVLGVYLPPPSAGPGTAVNPPATLLTDSLGFSRDVPLALLGVPSGSQRLLRRRLEALQNVHGTPDPSQRELKMTFTTQGPPQRPLRNVGRMLQTLPYLKKARNTSCFCNGLEMTVEAHSRLPMTSY